MSKWKLPPVIKIYEALGAIADERVIAQGNRAEVYSSEGNKHYDVFYDPQQNMISSNDNGSYWAGYLGYPSICLLMKLQKLPFNQDFALALGGIEWKKINDANRNDYDKTQQQVDKQMESKGISLDDFYLYLAEVNNQISMLGLNAPDKKMVPPKEGEKNE